MRRKIVEMDEALDEDGRQQDGGEDAPKPICAKLTIWLATRKTKTAASTKKTPQNQMLCLCFMMIYELLFIGCLM
jgi:hypothetical protein